MKRIALLMGLFLMTVHLAWADNAPRLELKDGDRVAFIGNTFVEREANDCYIETMLTTRYPDRNITFRNLGYSADTVSGEARGLCTGWSQFETADKGFARLRKLVAEYKPTVLLINYGMTESFSGPEKLPEFKENYGKMLDALSATAGTSPRIILMTPNHHEDLGRPLPDPAEHNKSLALYADAVKTIAVQRGCLAIDLFAITRDLENKRIYVTGDGIHLTPFGYVCVSRVIEKQLFGERPAWGVILDAKGTRNATSHAKILNTNVNDGKLSFTVQSELLPDPSMAGVLFSEPQNHITVPGLEPGTYKLLAENKTVEIHTDEEWVRSPNISCGPDFDQLETLRKVIVEKNFDYFNYQRPENDSYILAFRKGEQGKNAVEIPKFLPLVAEKEKQIVELRVPKPVTYTLTAVK